MDINFYQMTSNPKSMTKTLTLVSELTGDLLDDTSIEDPAIRFIFEAPPLANYVYIPAFGRYYFITGVECLESGMWRVSMHVDVLSSFKTEILNNECILDRQEHIYNLYQEDSMIGTYADTFTVCRIIKVGNSAKSFGTPVTGENVVLICT